MNELSLFAGAGGGLLASCVLGWDTVCAVEFDIHKRCVLVQRQNDRLLPAFPLWDDVRTFDAGAWRGSVDIVTGGFPCQAYSTAAAGKNTADDLWPEMLRVVADATPRYVFAENVSKKAINAACDDLEALGHETKAISLSAKGLGADHIRERHWLLAYSDDPRELLRGFNAEAPVLQRVAESVWKSYPGEPRMADGVAYRMDRLKATGNGQVPIVAISALKLMVEDVKWPRQ